MIAFKSKSSRPKIFCKRSILKNFAKFGLATVLKRDPATVVYLAFCEMF